ncbi:MAG: hypothetical protein ABL966_02050 [Acidimicrobiales bacterium]
METRKRMAMLVLLVGLVIGGCSDGGAAATGSDERPAGEVPDPCSLVDAATLEGLAGAAPGTGVLKGVAPEQRKVCSFESGLSVAVEVAENFDASVGLIRASPNGSSIESVEGLGDAAIWQDFGGGVGQVVASGDAYFVGVTVAAGGRPAAEAVAEAMLAEL